MTSLKETLLTVDEIAEYLRVKKRTIYDWLKKGKIPAIKTVGQWRFKKDQIDFWLNKENGKLRDVGTSTTT
jgi:PTS system nitrogen regulatory IIA component